MDDQSDTGPGGGGAVEIANAIVTMRNVVFMNSRVVNLRAVSPLWTSGGAVSITNSPMVTVEQSYFYNNSAEVSDFPAASDPPLPVLLVCDRDHRVVDQCVRRPPPLSAGPWWRALHRPR